MRLFCAAAALAFALVPMTTLASTIYTYTGQNYSSVGPLTPSATYNTTESVTGSFTLNTPLAANLTTANVSPTAFSFFDGVQTITDQTAFSDSFSLSTDAYGNITTYIIQMNNAATTGFIKLNNVGSGLSGDSVRLVTGVYASNTTAGTFQSNATAAAVTPEPSTMALLGTGLLAAAGVARRRRAVA